MERTGAATPSDEVDADSYRENVRPRPVPGTTYHYAGHHYESVHVGGGRVHMGNSTNSGPSISASQSSESTPEDAWSNYGKLILLSTLAVTRSWYNCYIIRGIQYSTPRPSSSNPPILTAPGSVPITPAEKTPFDLYRKAAGELPTVKNTIELWDINGIRSSRPELRRADFLEVSTWNRSSANNPADDSRQAVVMTYVEHFHKCGLVKLPYILMTNDNIDINERSLSDVVSVTRDVGCSQRRFAHYKMACWMGSANHFGFDVYIFREGSITHNGGSDEGDKG
jgi:hypothetical protein